MFQPHGGGPYGAGRSSPRRGRSDTPGSGSMCSPRAAEERTTAGSQTGDVHGQALADARLTAHLPAVSAGGSFVLKADEEPAPARVASHPLTVGVRCGRQQERGRSSARVCRRSGDRPKEEIQGRSESQVPMTDRLAPPDAAPTWRRSVVAIPAPNPQRQEQLNTDLARIACYVATPSMRCVRTAAVPKRMARSRSVAAPVTSWFSHSDTVAAV